MRLIVHDYSGHPFQMQLSRALAGRGHQVKHVYCPSYGGGKGALERKDGDPVTLEIEGVSLDSEFKKYSYVRRIAQELHYGWRFVSRMKRFKPDVLLSGNVPLFAQTVILVWARARRIPFIFWQQDIYSMAMRDEAKRKLPLVGGLVGRIFVQIEKTLLRRSQAIICISEDFLGTLDEWGIAPERVTVIRNWAPLDEITVSPRDNDWARQHGLGKRATFVYSGTLGLKHDPGILLELARRQPVDVVVVSEGIGADWLAAHGEGVPNLHLLPYQPYERLPEVLGCGDVLLILLEPEAGVFSVPSKTLSYLCAGRPLLAAMAAENLGAKTIVEAQAGLVTPPGDVEAFVAAAGRLIEQPEERARMATNSRSYAERTFVIDDIASAFEQVILRVGPVS